MLMLSAVEELKNLVFWDRILYRCCYERWPDNV